MSQKNNIEHRLRDSKHTSNRVARAVAATLVVISVVATVAPSPAWAFSISDLWAGTALAESGSSSSGNLQTSSFLRPANNFNPAPATGGGGIAITDDSALIPEEGPSGTLADIEKPKNATISTYIVREGDTLSGIAKMFSVTPSTILWANDLSKGSKLKTGESLVILPVTGVKYTVKKGDTLASIAKRFGGDAADIGSFNGVDNATLAVGDVIIIPDGEVGASSSASSSSSSSSSSKSGSTKKSGVTGPSSIYANNPKEPAHNVGAIGTLAQVSYYISPVADAVRTQGIHGYNAVDLAAPKGTPIVASAAGDVIVAREGGWNGGYGSYVVISHGNGAQTLYAHMSEVVAYDGQHVQQGQVIGYVGSTGSSTGPHVHFEIRNGIRNPF